MKAIRGVTSGPYSTNVTFTTLEDSKEYFFCLPNRLLARFAFCQLPIFRPIPKRLKRFFLEPGPCFVLHLYELWPQSSSVRVAWGAPVVRNGKITAYTVSKTKTFANAKGWTSFFKFCNPTSENYISWVRVVLCFFWRRHNTWSIS